MTEVESVNRMLKASGSLGIDPYYQFKRKIVVELVDGEKYNTGDLYIDPRSRILYQYQPGGWYSAEYDTYIYDSHESDPEPDTPFNYDNFFKELKNV